FVSSFEPAFECGERGREHGRARVARRVADACELVRLARSKEAREMFLFRAQDVDDEAATCLQSIMYVSAAINADEHERRLKRERTEGTNRQTERPRVLVLCRHDRHATGKTAERRAELNFVNRHERVSKCVLLVRRMNITMSKVQSLMSNVSL